MRNRAAFLRARPRPIAWAALAAMALLVALSAVPAEAQGPSTAAQRGSVSGRTLLEGRSRHNGVYVSLDGGEGGQVETTTDGVFAINNIPLGWHILRADMPRYLAVEGRFLASAPNTVLGDLIMTGGDAYGDNIIDILDLALVARNYDTAPPADARADINDNGMVDIYDLTIVSKNYDKRGPTAGQNAAVTVLPPQLSSVLRERPVTAMKAPSPSDPTLTWTLSPARPVYTPGDVVTAALRVDKGNPVYGVDITQPYNAKQLTPRDADPAAPEINGRVGDFFIPPSFAPVNRVADGEFRLGVASMAATPPPSAGTLAEVSFEVSGCGETSFNPAQGVKLSNEQGAAVPFNAAPPAILKSCP